MTILDYSIFKSPVGDLWLGIWKEAQAIGYLQFSDTESGAHCIESLKRTHSPQKASQSQFLTSLHKQLTEYFAGTRRQFSIDHNTQGTPFQKAVWGAVAGIKYAETRSYSDIAKQLSATHSQRAIGQANRRNPLLIIIPCHRVHSKSGKILGYSAGTTIQAKLLAHEQCYKA